MKIYVPSYTNNSCVVITDQDTIRVYESNPVANTPVNYVDYFINSHYVSKSGEIVFAENSFHDSCVSSSDLTSDFYYRNDLSDILIIFFMISFITLYIPFKVFSRAFGRWLKL